MPIATPVLSRDQALETIKKMIEAQAKLPFLTRVDTSSWGDGAVTFEMEVRPGVSVRLAFEVVYPAMMNGTQKMNEPLRGKIRANINAPACNKTLSEAVAFITLMRSAVEMASLVECAMNDRFEITPDLEKTPETEMEAYNAVFRAKSESEVTERLNDLDAVRAKKGKTKGNK